MDEIEKAYLLMRASAHRRLLRQAQAREVRLVHRQICAVLPATASRLAAGAIRRAHPTADAVLRCLSDFDCHRPASSRGRPDISPPTPNRGYYRMSEQGHDLHTEFAADRAILHALKMDDEHFRKLSDEHHHLTQEIYRIEGGLAASSDTRLETLKKKRLAVLDEIAGLIAVRKAA